MPEKKLNITGIVVAVAAVLLIIAGLMFAYFQAKMALPSAEVCDLVDNDLDGEIDEGFSVTCKVDTDCGPSGAYGETFCKEGAVYRASLKNTCERKPGTCLSECHADQTDELVQNCKGECANGACL